MKKFYQLLGNNLIAGVTNNFVWFALTFWTYAGTRSVFATAIISGIYLTITALSGFWFGSIVDHHKKKSSMMISSAASLFFFIMGFGFYNLFPSEVFKDVSGYQLWLFVVVLMLGVIAGNIRNIALPTAVTLLVPEKDRDKANGLSGGMMGVSFTLTSILSGVILGFFGMNAVLVFSIFFTVIPMIHLVFIPMIEKHIVHADLSPEQKLPKKGIDIKGTIAVVSAIPGLFGLLFFNVINNLLGGVYMSLMDAYGLNLVSIQTWGFMWGVLGLGFILGGIIINKYGLGKSPLRTMFLANIIMWTISIFFTIQPWIWLLALGMFCWITLVPFVEAAEQTIIQKVVPPERQGRVFGFAQSIEQSATPLMAFLIGPITQFIFIPFMTTGSGVDLIGSWFGTGEDRGMALVFTITGIIGLIITLLAIQTNSYKLLSKKYRTG